MVPLLLVVGPILEAIVESITKIKTSQSGTEFTNLSTNFFPLLNSMWTLIFIR